MVQHPSSNSSGGASSRPTDLLTTWLDLALVFVLKRHRWDGVLPGLLDDDVLDDGVELSNGLVV